MLDRDIASLIREGVELVIEQDADDIFASKQMCFEFIRRKS